MIQQFSRKFKKIRRKHFLAAFALIVLLLFVVKTTFPSIANATEKKQERLTPTFFKSKFVDDEGKAVKHRIYSVPSYRRCFHDLNDVQLATAKRLGVTAIADRDEAESRKDELVYMAANPFYEVDDLTYSIPYLKPHAALLLDEMARAYLDSLEIKGIPLQKFLVTSVLRTKDDIKRLQKVNVNASSNSCHQYGLTFDISYARFVPVDNVDGSSGRAVRNDTLKWVLSEVLNDFRKSEKCYIMYEVKQGCFHITARE